MTALLLLLHAIPGQAVEDKPLPANTWVELRQDAGVARRGCAVRYAAEPGTFFLWGFMDHDPEFVQENVAITWPEHDVVAFDRQARQWRNHLPKALGGQKLPPTWLPRCYHGLTSGSERSLFRPPEGFPADAARPDPNIVFDQVAYHPPTKALVYFTGGLTVAYHPGERRWTNLTPPHSPPPVLGGSLAYNPVHNELVLFGGGHVAESGPNRRIVGHTGTWIYSFANKDWRQLDLDVQPPPRMYTRLVTDAKNQVMVLFGGDGQSHYLADTWLFDLKARRWRKSQAAAGPPPRAGHFTVHDPETGWVIIGGGYHRDELTDMWAYDSAKDTWQRLAGDVPTGAYLTADLDPAQRLLLLVRNTRAANHGRNCDIFYGVRTSFAYRIDARTIVRPDRPLPQLPLTKRPAGTSGRGAKPYLEREQAQAERLKNLPVNQWVLLADPARAAPTRTWGSATFDSDRGWILYWGGGHCGYGGCDVDAYDVARHTWIGSAEAPEYLHRLWAKGVRQAGVSFAGNPWAEHGRRIYAYDPASHKMLCVRGIQLMTGYQPAALKDFPGEPVARIDAKVKPPTSYRKYATWSFDPDSGQWEILGPGVAGLDTLVTTRHGVMGINVDWPTRLNDAGYNLEWRPDQPEKDNAVYLYDSKQKHWNRLGEPQPSPQNLYEQTSLAHDTRRDQLILHGGGARRDQLWTFDLKTRRWTNRNPKVAAPAGGEPPVCKREAAYLPEQDLFLTYGPEKGGPALWVYRPAENTWQRMAIDPPKGVDPRVAAGQNRALVYDTKNDLVLMVLGPSNQAGAVVYALRYRDEQAKPMR